ncbi:MAG TPA: Arc family DNA-binding protein [Gaiellaceae bacterium]|nr:Arc family DNA-binding protein [Gaiellaceae bacterium]
MTRGDTYRFLLRMPETLRRRLSEAAESAGRSLNAEIVHRLEQSLEEPVISRRHTTKGEAVKRLGARRPLVALALVVLVAGALAVVGATQHTSRTPHGARYLKNDPDAHTVISARHSNLGSPASAEAQEIAELAYPSNTLRASLFQHARDFFTGHIRGRSRAHSNGWQLVGPSTATQPAALNFFDLNASDFQVSGRVTAMAVDPRCDTRHCRLWIAAAGGGIWRNDDALSSHSHWTYLSGDFGTNAIGALTYDQRSDTLYAGTGEPNASGDSESGVGIYASRDGGNHWSFLPGSLSPMFARSISSIVVDPHNPRTIYVGTARGVRGVSSVTGGAVSLAPDAAPWGLWKTTDGGRSFSQVWDGAGSIRGVNHVEIDSHGTIYAAAFQEGIWRSSNGGSTWEQVFATQDPANNAARTEFALNTTPDGHTRIYVGDGGEELAAPIGPFGVPSSNTGVYRADAIDTKTSPQLTDGVTNPGYVSLTSQTDPSDPTYDYCEGQCWYDNYVVSPAGHPDMVYVGGSFDYNFYYAFNTGRGVLFSQDAGQTWNDETRDASSQPTGIHPDQHALAVDPANPLLFFEGSDGGVVRSSGQTADASANCYAGYGTYTTNCQEMLSAVPTQITTLNDGLSTLQFQNAVPDGQGNLIGGTQDNGTWLGATRSSSWNQTIYGDGGVAVFDSQNPSIMMNEFYDAATDVNFENGDPNAWVIAGATFANSGEGSEFYKPQLADPVVGGTLFSGLQHIWRTQDDGGEKTYLEANCPEFTVSFQQPGCGDFVALGDPSGNGGPDTPGDLTSASYGDREGGFVVAMARTTADRSTMWAATATGRVFVTKNVDAPSSGDVTFTRIDNASSPNRFVSGITIDPKNANRAWITYTGYNANTPTTPGHVFQVDYNATTHTATWTDIDNGSGPIGDLPVTGIARDDATGTLYVSTDFTVLADTASPNGTYDGNWRPAANGLPLVEVAGVSIDPKSRTLYAATHGRGIWQLQLPNARGDHGHGH